MSELSPAAKAVLDACDQAFNQCGTTAQGLAVALRAAAHEVAPFPGRDPINKYMEGFRDAKQSVHHQLLGIAAELEGNYPESPDSSDG